MFPVDFKTFVVAMPNKHQQLNVQHRVETNAVTTDLYEYFWWCVKMANAFLQCVHEWGCLLLIRLDGCGTWLLWGGGGGYIICVIHITRCARMYVVRLKLYVRMIIVQCVPTSQSHFSSNNSRKTPITRPLGWGVGVFHEFQSLTEVWCSKLLYCVQYCDAL